MQCFTDCVICLLYTSAGIQVGTEKAWNSCKEFGIPKFFLINKTDKDNVDVDKVIADLKDKFGTSVVTLDDKEAMTEAIAETDEVLMEKFFSGEEFTDDAVSYTHLDPDDGPQAGAGLQAQAEADLDSEEMHRHGGRL